MSWVYTLTAEGTTHGFERGYFAFLGDPFGAEPVAGNLVESLAPSTAPEAAPSSLMLLGLAGLFLGRSQYVRSLAANCRR